MTCTEGPEYGTSCMAAILCKFKFHIWHIFLAQFAQYLECIFLAFFSTICIMSWIYFNFLDPSEKSGSPDPVYFKKCYPTPFHAKGCLTVDEEAVSFNFVFIFQIH